MSGTSEKFRIQPDGVAVVQGSVVPAGNVHGSHVQSRGTMQSLGELHVNGYAQFNEYLRVGQTLGIGYIHGWWASFFADWDWGGGGNIYARIDGAAWTDSWMAAPSDERLKQDIAPATFDCLDSVMRWPLYRFTWKDSEAPPVPIGFVAQRQEEVFPASVAKGRPEDGVWSVNANVAMAALTGAIQQLADRIEALEQRMR